MDFLNDTARHGEPGRLEGKRVVITGATSGIGRGCAMHMAEEGARIIFTGRNEEGAAETLRMVCEAVPAAEVEFLRQDVTVEADWTRLYDRVREKWGTMDVLLSNAGDAKLGPLEDVKPEDLDFLYKVNVEGQFLGLRDGLGLMAPGGSIIVMSSRAGLRGFPHGTAYTSAKGALTALTKVVAAEAAALGTGIRVNSVHPGLVWTESVERVLKGRAEELRAKMEANVPMGKIGHPRDVGELVCYLSCDDSRHITGAELSIDGGMAAQ